MFKILCFYIHASTKCYFLVRTGGLISLVELSSGGLIKNFKSLIEASAYLNANYYQAVNFVSESPAIIDSLVSCGILLNDKGEGV